MNDLYLEDRSVEPDPCERCQHRRDCYYQCQEDEMQEPEEPDYMTEGRLLGDLY